MFAGFAVLVLVSAGIVFGALGSVAVGGEHAETSIGFDRANPFAGSLTAGREYTVYLAVLRDWTTLPVTTCTARAADGAAVALPAKTGAGASDEYGNWFQLYALTPRRTGTYRVACESVGARAGGATRSVQPPTRVPSRSGGWVRPAPRTAWPARASWPAA